jgi:hypothetical protein
VATKFGENMKNEEVKFSEELKSALIVGSNAWDRPNSSVTYMRRKHTWWTGFAAGALLALFVVLAFCAIV